MNIARIFDGLDEPEKLDTAYLRHIEFEGALQWVLFDEDGEWIAASLDRWRVFDMAHKSGIKVVMLN